MILTKRAYIYERNTNTAFDTRTESKSVNGVDVIFALDQTVLDVNENPF